MTDRELLEAAANAAGYQLSEVSDMIWSDAEAEYVYWNPLTDDGDAFRLAVKLRIEIRPGTWAITAAGEGAWEEVSRECNDDAAATRRAIVRAAAQMSKGALGE